LASLGAFIECRHRSDFKMGASTLVKSRMKVLGIPLEIVV
jgi:hypothetical protein